MNIIPFNFESKEIRVVEINNEPWFVASDIASALEYRDAYDMTRILDDDEKGTHNLRTPGGEQLLSIINESGLYSAILRSRKPEAKAFKKWVTSDVLPSIRKTGSYQSKQFKIPATLSEALRLAADQADQIEQQKQVIAIQAPKAAFADRIASADKGTLLGNFAKTVGIGPKNLFKVLRDARILMSGGNRHNLPYQEYIERGYFEVTERTYEVNYETRIAFTPLITGKGQQWLTGRLIASGILKAVVAGGEA